MSVLNDLEKDVQNAICDYLSLRRVMFWRQSNHAVYSKKQERFLKPPKYARKGVPDILGITKSGTFFGIEVKRSKGGRQSKEQKEFMDDVRAAGGIYILASSIDDIFVLFRQP